MQDSIPEGYIEKEYRFDIPSKQKPARIDVFLTNLIERVTRNRIQNAIDRGFVTVNDKVVKAWAIVASIITLGISLVTLFYTKNNALNGLSFGYEWLKYIGSSFTMGLNGMGRVLTFLTAIAFPIIIEFRIYNIEK